MTVWNFGSHYNFRPQKRACLTQALFIGVTPHKLHIHSRTTPFKNCILYLQQEKPRHDRRGDFMKYQKKMIVPALALAMLLCGTMTAFAANANPANAENLREEGESRMFKPAKIRWQERLILSKTVGMCPRIWSTEIAS